MADGYIDTNVFIHAVATDEHSAECQQFLLLVQRGEVEVKLDVAVLHELSYMLTRFHIQMTRADISDYLLMILAWPGIEADKVVLIDAVARWKQTQGLAFVDAYLAERAVREGMRVYSKNVRELRAQGAEVPDPLPVRMPR
jgi:predicted nucleic acid-binding protein